MTKERVLAAIVLCAGAAVGCTGELSSAPSGLPGVGGDGVVSPGGPAVGGDGTVLPGPGGAGSPAMVDPADPNAAGLMPLRRLNRREYNNTVQALFGDDSRPADSFPVDRDGTFEFPRAALVSALDAAASRSSAERLAAAADVGGLLPCSPAAGEEACAQQFLETFGLKVYRRPLLADEITRLMDLYRAGRGEPLNFDFEGGVRLMIEAMLQSPAFLYHWEQGPAAPTLEGPALKLDGYAMASRLSYFLWRSMPDDALFQAAAQNQLGTEGEVAAQVERLLNDPRAKETTTAFFDAWLELDTIADRNKDLNQYPEFQDDLKAAMTAETEAFVNKVVFEGDGTLQTLLTSTDTLVNEPLAGVYGMTGVQGDQLQPASLNPAERAGILTQAGFLTVSGAVDGSHPVKRGKAIVTRILCRTLPPPPPDVPPAKPPSEGGTTRDRFAEHSQQACAVGCHGVMDPFGFAFENYDGIGRYRTMDNGLPVDATGTVEIDGVNQSFNNAIDLSALLAQSSEASACFTRQWVRYGLDRMETDLDEASIAGATAAFDAGGRSIRALLAGIATSRSFRYRIPAAGESL